MFCGGVKRMDGLWLDRLRGLLEYAVGRLKDVVSKKVVVGLVVGQVQKARRRFVG
jgi:hypothetical protein